MDIAEFEIWVLKAILCSLMILPMSRLTWQETLPCFFLALVGGIFYCNKPLYRLIVTLVPHNQEKHFPLFFHRLSRGFKIIVKRSSSI